MSTLKVTEASLALTAVVATGVPSSVRVNVVAVPKGMPTPPREVARECLDLRLGRGQHNRRLHPLITVAVAHPTREYHGPVEIG
jgi:hypothetical protein